MSKNFNFSSGTQFQLVFSRLPFEISNENVIQLQLKIIDSVAPGVQFSLSDQHGQGALAKYVFGNITFNDWSFNYFVDEDGNNGIRLFKGMTWINNNKDVYLKPKNEYSVDATQVIYNNYGTALLKIEYQNVFPYILGDITLNYQDGESYLKSSCNLAYDNYDIKKL